MVEILAYNLRSVHVSEPAAALEAEALTDASFPLLTFLYLTWSSFNVKLSLMLALCGVIAASGYLKCEWACVIDVYE